MQKIMIATEGGGLNSRNVVMVIVKKKTIIKNLKKILIKRKIYFITLLSKYVSIFIWYILIMFTHVFVKEKLYLTVHDLQRYSYIWGKFYF